MVAKKTAKKPTKKHPMTGPRNGTGPRCSGAKRTGRKKK